MRPDVSVNSRARVLSAFMGSSSLSLTLDEAPSLRTEIGFVQFQVKLGLIFRAMVLVGLSLNKSNHRLATSGSC